jgi:hypothetical protein
MTKHQLELIERYLEQKMSAAEMARFENALLHDPLLKNEFELQRDIVDSIKAYRKAEIKARLEGIKINPAPQFATYLKIAASVTLTSFMIWGAYTYFNAEDKEIITKVEIPAITETPFIPFIEEVPDMPLAQHIEPAGADIEVVTPKPSRRTERVAAKRELKLPEVRLPDVLANFEDTSPMIMDKGLPKPPTSFPNIDEKSLVPEILVKDLPGKKNQFFYQNYDGKLYLYGNFSASPYELIELNTEAGRRLFLNYDSSYFNIKPDQKDVVPLERIQDSSLVQELNVLKD